MISTAVRRAFVPRGKRNKLASWEKKTVSADIHVWSFQRTESEIREVATWKNDIHKRSEIVHSVIHHCHVGLLENMIANGWDVNEPLHIKSDTLKALLHPTGKTTALLEAARQLWDDGMMVLRKAGAQINQCSTELDPLTTVLCQDNLEHDVVNLLLKHGADPNAHHINDGETPLILAIRKCAWNGFDTSIVHLLLENGSDPNLARHQDALPIIQILQLLEDSLYNLTHAETWSWDELYFDLVKKRKEVRTSNAALLEHILSYGADINMSKGMTYLPFLHALLQVGCRSEQSEFLPEHLDIFYKHGGEINMWDNNHVSAIEQVISSYSHGNNIHWLIRHGAAVTALNFGMLKQHFLPHEENLTEMTCQTGWKNIPLVLLEAGLKVSPQLHLHLSQVQAILQRLPDNNEIDEIDSLEDMWSVLIEVDSAWSKLSRIELDHCERRHPELTCPEYRVQQMADLLEFSDASLNDYTEAACIADTGGPWQTSLDMINKVLSYLMQPRSLQWWCRCKIRATLVCLAPSVVKTLPGPAIPKRYILCHEL